jgi:energy-coupling factor transporter transmembrane protein EcfT
MSEQQNPGTTINVTVQNPKNAALAFVLAFLFGPLGLLYASVTGGIILILVSIALIPASFLTFGLASIGFPLVWIASMVWAVIAASGKEQAVITQIRQGNVSGAIDAATKND